MSQINGFDVDNEWFVAGGDVTELPVSCHRLERVRYGCMDETSYTNFGETRELPCLAESFVLDAVSRI
jgi:hypothetical protein